MDELWASVIAVAGTLLGGGLTYLLQERATRHRDDAVRDGETRRELRGLCAAFLGELTTMRRHQFTRYNLRMVDAPEPGSPPTGAYRSPVDGRADSQDRAPRAGGGPRLAAASAWSRMTGTHSASRPSAPPPLPRAATPPRSGPGRPARRDPTDARPRGRGPSGFERPGSPVSRRRYRRPTRRVGRPRQGRRPGRPGTPLGSARPRGQTASIASGAARATSSIRSAPSPASANHVRLTRSHSSMSICDVCPRSEL